MPSIEKLLRRMFGGSRRAGDGSAPRRVPASEAPEGASAPAATFEESNALGHTLLANGRTADSIRAFQQAVRCNPRSADAWLSLGHALGASGDGVRAQQAFFRCLSIDLAAAAEKRGLGQFLEPFAAASGYLPDLDPVTFAPRYPGIFIASLPKSGTAFLQEALCKGLNKPPLGAPSGGLFPNATIAQSAIERLNLTGAVYVTHCAPTEYNITEVKHRLEKIVIHVRDPRQALLSWVHFVPAVVRNADPVQRFHYGLPDDYESYSLAEQIDWQIEHRLADIVSFVEGWWEASRRPDMGTRFLFTRHENLSANSRQFFMDLLEFYKIPADSFTFPERPQQGQRNFREGRTDEWREAFTPAQIDKANSMIPRSLAEQFRWEGL